MSEVEKDLLEKLHCCEQALICSKQRVLDLEREVESKKQAPAEVTGRLTYTNNKLITMEKLFAEEFDVGKVIQSIFASNQKDTVTIEKRECGNIKFEITESKSRKTMQQQLDKKERNLSEYQSINYAMMKMMQHMQTDEGVDVRDLTYKEFNKLVREKGLERKIRARPIDDCGSDTEWFVTFAGGKEEDNRKKAKHIHHACV